AQIGIAAKNAPNALIVPTIAAITANTMPLAASTRRRAGTDVNVVRIAPVEYSDVTTSTPSTAIASCPKATPAMATFVGSSVARSAALILSRLLVVPHEASIAKPTVL